MSAPNLATLPPEIVTRIAIQLDTPRDLAAFIKTSRYAYQVFQHSRITILVAVIRNAMPNGNIYIAAAACSAASVSKLWWTGSSAVAIADAQEEFFKSNPHGRAPEDCSLRDQKLLHSLYRLWWIADYFLCRFAQTALETAALKMPSSVRQPSLAVSCDERSRLQRALLRYEIFRRTTPSHFDGKDGGVTYQRSWFILKHFPPWEREEILCVQEFLVDFAKDVVRKSEDFFVQEVATVAREMASKAELPLEVDESEPEPQDPMARLKLDLDWSCFDIFDYHISAPRRFQYFVGRGLPFLRWLSNLAPQQMIHVSKRHVFDAYGPTVWEVLSSCDDHLTTHDITEKWLDMKSTGDLQSPNSGWMWAVAHDLTIGERLLRKRYSLRRMGYVFWDQARFHGQWRLQDTSPSMLNLTERKYDDDDTDREKSIEHQFKDVPIPKHEAAYDESRDDSIYGRLRVDRQWELALERGLEYATPFSKKEDEAFHIEY